MAATTAIGMVMPIAAASIVSVGLFAWMWRAHQHDRTHGKAPWYLTVSIFIVPAIYGALGYWLKGEASTEYVDVFRVAMVAQAVTFAFLFCLSNALWAGRGKPLRSRAFPAAFALGLAVLVLSGAFTG